MEILDIVDENGNPTGETVERKTAHRNGIRHRTSHVWLARRRGDTVEILLQKRSHNKDSYPDCYDISSAGHIPAGVDFIPSALRELQEELGVTASAGELIPIGIRRIDTDEIFHGEPFHDRQVSKVFLLWHDAPESAFSLQKEELTEVRWMELNACIRAVQTGSIKNCIVLEELQMITDAVNAQT